MKTKKLLIADYSIRISAVIAGVFILCIGIALSVKADLGMGTYDGMTATIADVLHLKIGTLSIILNYCLIICQLVVEGKNFSRLQLLQFPNVFLCGVVLNFFTYTVFGSLEMDNYLVRLAVSVLSNVIRAAGITLILESEFIRSAMEGLVQVICDKRGRKLGRTMQVLDAVYIAVSLALSFFFKTPYRIREGTVLAMLIFGPCLDLFRKPAKKLKAKLPLNQKAENNQQAESV